MRSVAFDGFGGPEVLRLLDRPIPAPAPGEVVVRVAASTVNPTDLMMRRGEQAALMTHLSPPFVAGMEFAGRIHAVGAGVDLAAGAPVVGVVNPRRTAGGAHAEYLLVPSGQVATVPEGTDLVGAATVPMNALTALQALDQCGLRPGQLLFVTGGAGILGGSVLQLARRAGLRTVANAAAADADLVRDLGADVVVPRDEGLADAFRAQFPEGADALIDGALIGPQVSHLVRDGGKAISLRKSHPVGDPRLDCGYVSVIEAMARPDFLRAIADHLATGGLRPRVAPGGVFPMDRAAAAHAMAETWRGRGRVVLTF